MMEARFSWLIFGIFVLPLQIWFQTNCPTTSDQDFHFLLLSVGCLQIQCPRIKNLLCRVFSHWYQGLFPKFSRDSGGYTFGDDIADLSFSQYLNSFFRSSSWSCLKASFSSTPSSEFFIGSDATSIHRVADEKDSSSPASRQNILWWPFAFLDQPVFELSRFRSDLLFWFLLLEATAGRHSSRFIVRAFKFFIMIFI